MSVAFLKSIVVPDDGRLRRMPSFFELAPWKHPSTQALGCAILVSLRQGHLQASKNGISFLLPPPKKVLR